jgi:hypothetical protein
MDVDGVLCPFGYGHYNFDGNRRNLKTPRWVPDGGDFIFNNQVGVFYDPKNGERLTELMNYFDLRWCTGWGDQANIDIGPLHGLPRLPVVPISFYTSKRYYWEHWKLGGIVGAVGDRPFAFVDDDIGPESIAWARKRTAEVAPTLFLRTDPIEGFTEDTYQQLLLFAKVVEDDLGWRDDPTIDPNDSHTWSEYTMSPRRALPSGTTRNTLTGWPTNSEPTRNTRNRSGRKRRGGKRYR